MPVAASSQTTHYHQPEAQRLQIRGNARLRRIPHLSPKFLAPALHSVWGIESSLKKLISFLFNTLSLPAKILIPHPQFREIMPPVSFEPEGH
jgi:hypothetical protein